MTTILGIILSILLLFRGLLIWAKSDIPAIFREIAINTRKDKDDGSNYSAVKILSGLNKLVSILLWFLAVIILVASIKYGKEYDKILFGTILK
jgi:hypothetical protein